MSEKENKKLVLLFRIFTGIFSAQMLLSAGMYFFKYEIAFEAFGRLGFPAFVIYPLGVAKILGLVAIWSNRSETLKKLAYAGFFYNMILAISAHISVGDGLDTIPSALALVFLICSYKFDNKLTR